MQNSRSPMVRAFRSAFVVSLAAMAVAAQAESWKIVELKGPEGSFFVLPYSVDQGRNVYGQAQMMVGGIQPVRWMAATGYKPEVLGNKQGYLRGNNGKGHSVGLQEMTVAGPSGKAILWGPDGTSKFLELPDYKRAEAVGVNTSMMAAGTFITADFHGTYAFRWSESEVLQLPTLTDLPYSYGTGINNAGFVVGYGVDSTTVPTKSSGFFWSPTGGLQKLPPVGSFYRATGLNNTGLVCGFGRYQGVGAAIVWPTFGIPAILDPLAGYPHAEALSVNDAGDIVGNAWTGAWNNRKTLRPVAWFDRVCHDITAESGITGAVLGLAHGINGRGDVVGEANFAGHNSGFIAIRK